MCFSCIHLFCLCTENHSMVSTQSSTALLELHHYPASLGMYVVINSLSTSYLLSRLLLVYSKFLPLINLQVIEWLEYAPTGS